MHLAVIVIFPERLIMSHITVPAAKVVEAATKTLKRIEEVRTRKDEETITKTMATVRKYVFFGRKLTREEAIAYQL
jgi:hypothetical protein